MTDHQTHPWHVPNVDISAWTTEGPTNGAAAQRAAVAAEVDEACRTVGFIQITGHGVPDQVLAGLGEAMDDFFDQDLETKKRLVRPAWENRGYSPPKSESLSLSAGVESAARMNDFFEAFNVGRALTDYPGLVLDDAMAEHYAVTTWPPVAGFEARTTAYAAHAERVARTLTEVFGAALGLPPSSLAELTEHSIGVLRMNNYALPDGTDVTLDGDLTGMGEHTDFGIVTVLWADRVRGLQVLDGDGVWHDVEPADGALLVNLGDLTARLTNERWVSTLHRVKPPVVDGRIQRRRSAAFFLDGNADATVGPLPSCVDAEHPALYSPVTVDAHVRGKLAGSRVGRLNDAAERESARLLRATDPR